MKCAAELIQIARDAENARAIERAKEEERKRQRAIVVAKQTINWCETALSKFLEKLAENDPPFSKGYWSSHGICFDNFLGLNRLRPLVSYYKYANGKPSFTSSSDPNKELDFAVIQEYCRKYCVEVQTSNHEYMEYGFGRHFGVKLLFRLSPECFK